MMTQPNPTPKDYDLLAPVPVPPGVTAGDWYLDAEGHLLRTLSDGRIQCGSGEVVTECKHCTVPEPTITQRLDASVNMIDLARGDINAVIRDLPEDTSMWVIVDITNALGSLRNAAVMLDKANDAIEADALPAQSTVSHSHQLADLHRRIRTVLAMAPASSWSVDEAQTVWNALAEILAGRQTEAVNR